MMYPFQMEMWEMDADKHPNVLVEHFFPILSFYFIVNLIVQLKQIC